MLDMLFSTSWRIRITVFSCVLIFTLLQVLSTQQSIIVIWSSDASTIIVQDAPAIKQEAAAAAAVVPEDTTTTMKRNPNKARTAAPAVEERSMKPPLTLDTTTTRSPEKLRKKKNMKKEAAVLADFETNDKTAVVTLTPPATTNSATKDANVQEDDTINNGSSNFQGTQIRRLSSGVDMYENVCIYRKNQKATAEVWSYSKSGKSMRHTAFSKYRQGTEIFMTQTKGFPLENWYTDTKTASLFPNETLWTQVLFNNPAHALTDVIFTLALDRFQRPEAERPGEPFYPHYLIGRFKGFDDPPLHPKARYKWLIGMLRALNLVNPEEGVVGTAVPLSCFEKLLVPAIRMHRFPLSRQEDPEGVENLLQFSEKKEHNFVDPDLDYPTAALKDVHQRALIGLGLPNQPWPLEEDLDQNKVILLHIRARTQRRKLTNAKQLKELLETKYLANVTIISDSWLPFSFQKQAATYNEYRYIITAHGAHLANAIFCRERTKIVEIFCNKHKNDLNPDPTLTERGTNTTFKDWWGGSYAQWFEPFTRRIGIDHFERGEQMPQQCGGHFTDITINIPETLPLIVNRFGLVPRDNSMVAQK